MKVKNARPAPTGTIRPRSPFTDFNRKPHGGPHASRQMRLERQHRRQLNQAINQFR